MRLIISSLLLTLLALSPATAAEPAKPVAAKPAIAAASAVKGIGVVDVVVLMRTSKAAQSIEKQLNDKRKVYGDSLAAQEKSLKAKEDQILKEKAKLKPAEFDAKRKEFEKSVRELQRSAQSKHRALEKAADIAVGKLQASITKVVAEIARSKKLQLVLTRDQVVIVEQSLDITAPALAALNKALPDVKVTIEEKK